MSRELKYETATDRYPPRRKGYRARQTAKKRRADDAVAKTVREKCVERDGYCRIGNTQRCDQVLFRVGDSFSICANVDPWGGICRGPSQWSHMEARRRSKTRNQAPEIRHDTKYSFMACRQHHDQYDNRDKPRLFVTALTSKGANGPLKFRLGK